MQRRIQAHSTTPTVMHTFAPMCSKAWAAMSITRPTGVCLGCADARSCEALTNAQFAVRKKGLANAKRDEG